MASRRLLESGDVLLIENADDRLLEISVTPDVHPVTLTIRDSGHQVTIRDSGHQVTIRDSGHQVTVREQR